LLNDFIAAIAAEFEQEGYLVERNPGIAGVQALLYARSPRRFRLGFAKVEDHFLLVDWDNAAFGRLEHLLEIHRRFSAFVNLGFRTPHALRMQIPNLALAAVSVAEFPEETARRIRASNLTPWYGGETGQIILVNLQKKDVIFQKATRGSRYPRPGDFPLTHAAETIQDICRRVF
jgi:hypothetical protein